MTYTAGFNQPGYLPESEPSDFDTFDEAKRYIIDELEHAADDAEAEEDGEEYAEAYANIAEDVNLESRGFSTTIMPDGYVYWVMET